MKRKFTSLEAVISISLVSLTSSQLLLFENSTGSSLLNKVETLNSKTKENNTNDSFDNKWISSIKESFNSSSVKIFFTRNATLAYQQLVNVVLYMLEQKKVNTNSKTREILWVHDYGVTTWNYDSLTQLYNSIKDTRNYDLDFKNIVAYSQLNNPSIINQNTKYFNCPSSQMYYAIYDYYKNTSICGPVKFDVWTTEASLSESWNTWGFYDFFKHVNKFYVISDGNYQSYYFVWSVIDFYNRQSSAQMTDEELKNLTNQYRNDTSNLLFYQFQNNQDYYRLINNSDLFTFFHIKEYTNSSYYKKFFKNKDTKLYNSYQMNFNYYDVALKLFDNSRTDVINDFVKYYELFFNLSNFNSFTSFFEDGSNYSANKKNVIWLGDSLVKEDKYIYDEKVKEVNGFLNGFLNLYPSDSYNFFIKPHPIFTSQKQNDFIKKFLGNDKLSHAIYFRNVPWELILSWDYKMYKTDKNYHSFFNFNNPNKVNFTFVGLQFTTTSLLTTAFFLEDFYGYNLNQVEKVVNSRNFPVPETYDWIARTTNYSNPEKQYYTNLSEREKLYQPFIDEGYYPDDSSSQLPGSVFINKYYTNWHPQKNTSNSSTKTTIIWSSILVSSLIIIIVAIICVFLYKRIKSQKPIKKAK